MKQPKHTPHDIDGLLNLLQSLHERHHHELSRSNAYDAPTEAQGLLEGAVVALDALAQAFDHVPKPDEQRAWVTTLLFPILQVLTELTFEVVLDASHELTEARQVQRAKIQKLNDLIVNCIDRAAYS